MPFYEKKAVTLHPKNAHKHTHEARAAHTHSERVHT